MNKTKEKGRILPQRRSVPVRGNDQSELSCRFGVAPLSSRDARNNCMCWDRLILGVVAPPPLDQLHIFKHNL